MGDADNIGNVDTSTNVANMQARLAALTLAIGTEDFAAALVDFVGCIAAHDGALAVSYAPDRKPEILLNSLQPTGTADRCPRYLAGAYLLDPFYLLACRLNEPALERLADIAPRDFAESDYYVTYYKAGAVTDEINYLVPIQHHQVFALCIEKTAPGDPFTELELTRLRSWLVVIAAFVCRHFMLADAGPQILRVDDEHLRLKSKLERFASSVLSPRELEVVRLMLNGHDTQAIAHQLTLSHETVRVHRRNIYRKLRVASIAELFALAMQAVLTPDNDTSDPLSQVRPSV